MSTRSAPGSRSCGRGSCRRSARRSRLPRPPPDPNSVVRMETRRPSPSRNAKRTPVTTLAGAPLSASRSATRTGRSALAAASSVRDDAPRARPAHSVGTPRAPTTIATNPTAEDERVDMHTRIRLGIAGTTQREQWRERDRAHDRQQRAEHDRDAARVRTRSSPESRARSRAPRAPDRRSRRDRRRGSSACATTMSAASAAAMPKSSSDAEYGSDTAAKRTLRWPRASGAGPSGRRGLG